MKSKYIFFALWLLLLVLPIYTVIKGTPYFHLFQEKPTLWLGFFQRVTGLLILTLLPIQIILGAFMTRLAEKFGSWIFWFHITQAVLIYILVLSHPLLFVFIRKTGSRIDPFYVFTDICVICKTKTELYYTFGRLSFWLVTLGFLVGKFRTHPLLQKHWQKIHILNYFTFFLIALHAYKVGTDIHFKYFYPYYIGSLIVVGGILLYKIKGLLKFKFKLR